MKRGDIYRADLDPVVGSEQGGIRPVLIRAAESGLPTDSVVLTEQVRTLEKSRLSRYLGHLSEEAMARIDQALEKSIGRA